MAGTIWERLAAPLNPAEISWRIDSKPVQRNGKYYARFVCYVEAGTVRERLDSVAPGEWDLMLTRLPECADSDGVPQQAFQVRLQISGVIREDVGIGTDYKQAATDAFKRVAVRFGIGHELYAMEQNWVEVDGDGKYAKAVEDPQMAYNRRYGASRSTPEGQSPIHPTSRPSQTGVPDTESTSASSTEDVPACPKCGGKVWDNRATRRNPKAPDFKCRDRNCDGVIWPDKKSTPGTVMDEQDYDPTQAMADDDMGLPF